MNNPIKVLIADDSAIIRRLLRETIDADPELEVVAAVANGRLAVDETETAKPDVIVLDIEMPEMDGVQATREIRKLDARIPILIFSSLTTAGGRATLDALAAGANDCIAKPANCGRLELAIEKLKSELIPAIKELAGSQSEERKCCCSPEKQKMAGIGSVESESIQLKPDLAPSLVVIGVSTGGPVALATLLQQLPECFSVPILIVQHMPPTFTHLLAERLNKSCKLNVAEASHDSVADAGHVFLAPGSHHMRVAQIGNKLQIHLDEGQPENSCRPSVDVLFRSAAMNTGDRTLGVVLTGMGKDGLAGSQNIKDAGGYVIAQDECSSTVWGMPGEVVRNGLADQVLPLEQIAGAMTRIVVASPTHLTISG